MPHIQHYFSSGWNILDSVGILFFITGFLYHFIYTKLLYDEDVLGSSRMLDGDCPLELSYPLKILQVIYGISFMAFVVKLLHYFVVFEAIGSKVLMLKKMQS